MTEERNAVGRDVRAQLRACVRSRSEVSGHYSADLTVNAEGQLIGVDVQTPDARNQTAIGACVRNRIADLSFGAHANGNKLHFDIQYQFRAGRMRR